MGTCGEKIMNDAYSKKLEEMKRRAQTTVFTTDVDKDHLSHGDIICLIDKVKEQDREIDYQRRHRKWALKQCRIWQRHFCFYKDDAVRFHSDRADKAEAELRRATRGYRARINELEMDSEVLREAGLQATDDLLKAEARVEQLEKLYRHTHVGPNRMCAKCELDLTDALHVRAVLAEKEKGE